MYRVQDLGDHYAQSALSGCDTYRLQGSGVCYVQSAGIRGVLCAVFSSLSQALPSRLGSDLCTTLPHPRPLHHSPPSPTSAHISLHNSHVLKKKKKKKLLCISSTRPSISQWFHLSHLQRDHWSASVHPGPYEKHSAAYHMMPHLIAWQAGIFESHQKDFCV